MSKLFAAEVVSNTQVAPGVFKLVMCEAELARLARPGQFLNIRVSAGTAPLLRRPISVHWVEGDNLTIIFQVVGQGTQLLAQVQSGGRLDVQGPLGHGFNTQTSGQAILVGGGMGLAPLGLLAQTLHRQGRTTLCLAGGRTAELVQASGGSSLAGLGLPVHYATDDGSLGLNGLVTELLLRELPREAVIYACGPQPMLREVAKLAQEHGIPCQVSLEEHMGCGVGACLGCMCKTAMPQGKEYYQRVCTEGPVFDAAEVVWQ